MVLASGATFATLPVLAKLAYLAGLGTAQTLAYRFALAAIGMSAFAIGLGQNPARLPRRRFLALLGLGFVVYTGQSLTYFIALRTLPASLVVLIAYIYPSLVVVAGWLLLRRSISPWHAIALVASFTGVALLVGGARLTFGWGLAFAVASPAIYTAYILIGERVFEGVPPAGGSAVIMFGAAVAFCGLAAASHELALPNAASGWAVAAAVALVPTMAAISLFLAGLPRVGAARAALLSTIEPVVAVAIAAVVLGERLTPLQAAGGVLVVLAVVLVQAAHLWTAGAPQALK